MRGTVISTQIFVAPKVCAHSVHHHCPCQRRSTSLGTWISVIRRPGLKHTISVFVSVSLLPSLLSSSDFEIIQSFRKFKNSTEIPIYPLPMFTKS